MAPSPASMVALRWLIRTMVPTTVLRYSSRATFSPQRKSLRDGLVWGGVEGCGRDCAAVGCAAPCSATPDRRRCCRRDMAYLAIAACFGHGDIAAVLVHVHADVQRAGDRFTHGPTPRKFATSQPTIGPVHWCSSAGPVTATYGVAAGRPPGFTKPSCLGCIACMLSFIHESKGKDANSPGSAQGTRNHLASRRFNFDSWSPGRRSNLS